MDWPNRYLRQREVTISLFCDIHSYTHSFLQNQVKTFSGWMIQHAFQPRDDGDTLVPFRINLEYCHSRVLSSHFEYLFHLQKSEKSRTRIQRHLKIPRLGSLSIVPQDSQPTCVSGPPSSTSVQPFRKDLQRPLSILTCWAKCVQEKQCRCSRPNWCMPTENVCNPLAAGMWCYATFCTFLCGVHRMR